MITTQCHCVDPTANRCDRDDYIANRCDRDCGLQHTPLPANARLEAQFAAASTPPAPRPRSGHAATARSPTQSPQAATGEAASRGGLRSLALRMETRDRTVSLPAKQKFYPKSGSKFEVCSVTKQNILPSCTAVTLSPRVTHSLASASAREDAKARPMAEFVQSICSRTRVPRVTCSCRASCQ